MKRFSLILLLILALGLFSWAYGAPKAGSFIVNTAVATYEDDEGFSYRAFSNTVILQVAPVYALEITPDSQRLKGIPGAPVEIPFYLKNTGNAEDRYALDFSNLTGDDGDFEDLKLFIDVNGNGRVDPGEPLYDNSAPPSLAPGEVLPLILFGFVPSDVKEGALRAELSGSSLSNPRVSDQSNEAVVEVTSLGFVSLKKEASKRVLLPGEKVTFKVSFTNPGATEVGKVAISVDLDGDGAPERAEGVLVYDRLPEGLVVTGYESSVPEGEVVYKGEEDSFWRTDPSSVKGELRAIGLILPSLEPDQQGYLKFSASAVGSPGTYENVANALFSSGKTLQKASSNAVVIRVAPVARVVVDDVDDGGNYTGSGSPDDPDDLTVIPSTTSGRWVEFRNEVWNLGNAPDTIDLSVEENLSNLPKGAVVRFFSPSGVPLGDTDGDGLVDLGEVEPGKRVEFVTKLFIPNGSYSDLLVAVKGSSSLNPQAYDLTFDKVGKAEPVKVQVLTRVQTFVQAKAQIVSLPLEKKKIVVYEYGNDSKPLRSAVFWTDEEGFIAYDEEGRRSSVYDWMRYGYTYRLTVLEEINGFSYYLTAPFEKAFFDSVSSPGEEKCWDFEGREVSCDSPSARVKLRVEKDGTKLLINSLDPAGFVYDGITGEKVDGACVTFYRCVDEACTSYSPVDPGKLDLYPDGATPQENPQVSGPTDGQGTPVGKGKGAFEFVISNFTPSDVGWYFIGVDFDCSLPAADQTLGDKYSPVTLRRGEVWDPYSGKPYRGERFFVDHTFPGAILLRVPLLPSSFKPLRVVKSVSSSTASIGDFVMWRIKVENPNENFTVYDVEVTDLLPKGLRYKGGTTRIGGKSSSDPRVEAGRKLVWRIGELKPKSSVEITFYSVVTPGIREAKLKNVAYASGWSSPDHAVKVGSNEAFAYLRLTKGVFTDRGYIVGRVFIDQNRNGVCDEREQGVKGVKIYLEDGRFAVTDGEGKFHFDDVRPGTHVVKVDPSTLPENAFLEVTSSRNAGYPGTVFADVYPGDLFKVNFALVPASVKAKFKGELSFPEGTVEVKRTLEDLLVDPSSGKVALKNSLQVVNSSSSPLYEVVYSEVSPYKPRKGSSYLNGTPFDDPEYAGEAFYWKVPLVLPGEEARLTWISDLPSEAGKVSGELKFSLKPYGRSDTKVSVKVPVVFEAAGPDTYKLTVYFDFGSYELSPEAKASIEKVAQFLRKRDYKTLIVKVEGHTDAVPVREGAKGYKDNKELSLKRARAVTDYLRRLLIDTRRVKVER